jgi:DNA-binding PadR family transcriptional regulator
MHGYLIAKITNDQIGPWARISSGTLYTILARLEQTGLIKAQPAPPPGRGRVARPTDRRSRTFAITEEARKRFHQLMMDTTSNLGDYQKVFYYNLGYLDLLRPDGRLLLLNHYANYCQTSVLHPQTEMEGLKHELAHHPSPAYLRNLLRVMTHVAQQWQTELAWVQDVREQVRAEAGSVAPEAGDAPDG